MLDIVEEFRRTSEPCLLLVHPAILRLEEVAHDVLASCDWPHLSVGQELSPVLLLETPQRRPMRASDWLRTRLGDVRPGPVIIGGIDLLFEPALSLNPVGLFGDVSRFTRLVVTWPGTYKDNVLAYAVPDHSRYCTWRNPSVRVVPID